MAGRGIANRRYIFATPPPSKAGPRLAAMVWCAFVLFAPNYAHALQYQRMPLKSPAVLILARGPIVTRSFNAADLETRAFVGAWAAYVRHDYPTTLTLLRPLAERGYAAAQDLLGWMYLNGEGVPPDDVAALEWYRKAARQEYAPAEADLGRMYQFGLAVPKSIPEAVKLYRRAAEQGYAPAQTVLGAMYYIGDGVTKNYSEGAKWDRKAAEQGIALAEADLGSDYALGRGIKKDYALAVHWFRMAAEQGDAVAQAGLGLFYRYGRGVPRNYVRAYMWFNLAAAGGDREAAESRDRLERIMTADQIAEAQRLSAAWRPTRAR